MVKHIIYLFIAMLLPLISMAASGEDASFKKANALYAKGNYKQALEIYKKIADAGYRSVPLYYNMGNASYKLDDIPAAVLYFEKAHRLSPGDEDINFNIRHANLKITDKIVEVPEFFVNRWWRGFILAFSLNALSILSIALFLIASALLILYFFAYAVAIKKSAFYASVLLFFLGLSTIFIANRQAAYFDTHKQAIVFTTSVTVKSGPVEKANTLFVLHDGTKVNILDQNNGWMKIRLANGNEGWIKADDAKEI